jgi:hypothetical protein
MLIVFLTFQHTFLLGELTCIALKTHRALWISRLTKEWNTSPTCGTRWPICICQLLPRLLTSNRVPRLSSSATRSTGTHHHRSLFHCVATLFVGGSSYPTVLHGKLLPSRSPTVAAYSDLRQNLARSSRKSFNCSSRRPPPLLPASGELAGLLPVELS